MADLKNLLERLSNEFGPSGRERAVRALIKAEVEPLVDRLDVDAMGNLITFKAGTGPEPRLKVMLSAHMDEVGFMITEVGKNGLLSFHTVGGIDAQDAAGETGAHRRRPGAGRHRRARAAPADRGIGPQGARMWTTWASTSARRTTRPPTARSRSATTASLPPASPY